MSSSIRAAKSSLPELHCSIPSGYSVVRCAEFERGISAGGLDEMLLLGLDVEVYAAHLGLVTCMIIMIVNGRIRYFRCFLRLVGNGFKLGNLLRLVTVDFLGSSGLLSFLQYMSIGDQVPFEIV